MVIADRGGGKVFISASGSTPQSGWGIFRAEINVA